MNFVEVRGFKILRFHPTYATKWKVFTIQTPQVTCPEMNKLKTLHKLSPMLIKRNFPYHT